MKYVMTSIENRETERRFARRGIGTSRAVRVDNPNEIISCRAALGSGNVTRKHTVMMEIAVTSRTSASNTWRSGETWGKDACTDILHFKTLVFTAVNELPFDF